MTLGTVVVPEILTATTAIDIDVPLAAGWNWMSLNVFTDDMSLGNMLTTISDNAIYIKNQSGYANNYGAYGWFGTLENIDNVSMFKLEMEADDNIQLSGMPVDVATTLFDLAAGWNWIGYTPQSSIDVNTALANIPDGNAEYLKSQSGYANYYGSEFGWFGTLETMNPFLGYQLQLTQPTSFVYNDALGRAPMHNSEPVTDHGIYNINIHDYEFNGSITVALYEDGQRLNSSDYVLAAFDDNECVGYTSELIFPIDGEAIYPLMVYNNETNKSLEYEVHEISTGKVYKITETVPFVKYMKYGDGLEPIAM